ncbi:hypothetical protein MN0502_35350 (plasmid) [Arthrobacter sp. MN05-02]|nr:hypothetical protein MN0502_35350 [Arthrobacter sp. MN05-02]
MNSRLTPAEDFPKDLKVLHDIEIQVLRSRVQRQLDHEYAYEFETNPETEFRLAELSEDIDRRDAQAAALRVLAQHLMVQQ